MKIKMIFCIVFGVGMVFLIYKNLPEVSQPHHHRSVPYNQQKINWNGEYQPFYGYTIVAMIDPSLAKAAARIEEFLRTSSLASSYSALPATTYHMTLYSIYQCGTNRMIPSVERWVKATGEKISSRLWLPDKVLQQQHVEAACVIEKYFAAEPLQIKYATLTINERGIKLVLEAEEESIERIRRARQEFARIYEDPDLSMEPIDERLHLGLAYVYAPTDNPNMEEWNQLNKLVRIFNGAKLVLPSVYLFDSMTNYIPHRKGNEIHC